MKRLDWLLVVRWFLLEDSGNRRCSFIHSFSFSSNQHFSSPHVSLWNLTELFWNFWNNDLRNKIMNYRQMFIVRCPPSQLLLWALTSGPLKQKFTLELCSSPHHCMHNKPPPNLVAWNNNLWLSFIVQWICWAQLGSSRPGSVIWLRSDRDGCWTGLKAHVGSLV